MSAEHAAKAVKLAEEAGKRIQRILLDLDETLGASYGVNVSAVDVDTRNFGQMRVEIHID